MYDFYMMFLLQLCLLTDWYYCSRSQTICDYHTSSPHSWKLYVLISCWL